MDSIGLEELRRHASVYIKRAEAGESMLITVAGRPSAVLGPAERKQWNTYDEISDVFAIPVDPTLADDLANVHDEIRDPWQA